MVSWKGFSDRAHAYLKVIVVLGFIGLLPLTARADDEARLYSPLPLHADADLRVDQQTYDSFKAGLIGPLAALDTDNLLALAERPPVRQRERSRDDVFQPKAAKSAVLWRDVSLKNELSMSQRSDSVYWSIANDVSGQVGPNVLSELDYQNLRIRGVELSSSLAFEGGWLNDFYLSGQLFKGTINDGQTRDSDYNGSNRTQEYSRSLSENTGDFVADYSVALGRAMDSVAGLNTVLELGYSLHQQYLRKQNAIQVFDPSASGEVKGLNSTYQSEWQGPWLGLGTTLSHQRHVLNIRTELHQALYYAEANWNLRDTFMHPKSFDHQADGRGLVIEASYAYTFKLPQAKDLTLALSYRRDRWQAENGLDTLYLVSGQTVTTRLNEVLWSADAVALGIKFIH